MTLLLLLLLLSNDEDDEGGVEDGEGGVEVEVVLKRRAINRVSFRPKKLEGASPRSAAATTTFSSTSPCSSSPSCSGLLFFTPDDSFTTFIPAFRLSSLVVAFFDRSTTAEPNLAKGSTEFCSKVASSAMRCSIRYFSVEG